MWFVQYLLCLSHLMSRQRLQCGNDVASPLKSPGRPSPNRVFMARWLATVLGSVVRVRRDVHGRLSVLRLLFGVSHLCDDTHVHFLHPHVQNASIQASSVSLALQNCSELTNESFSLTYSDIYSFISLSTFQKTGHFAMSKLKWYHNMINDGILKHSQLKAPTTVSELFNILIFIY